MIFLPKLILDIWAKLMFAVTSIVDIVLMNEGFVVFLEGKRGLLWEFFATVLDVGRHNQAMAEGSIAERSVSLSFFSSGVVQMTEYSRQYSNEYQSNVICVKPQNCY